jgi:hypothetical protein
MSDQKCIYRRYKSPRPGSNDCGLSVDAHKEVRDHDFQPPLEISAEAVEAAVYAYFDGNPPAPTESIYREDMRAALEAAYRVMQKGQDE